MADSRNDWGEYGGKPGSIQKAEDGHEDLTAAEQRRIMATYGIRNSAAAVSDPEAVEVPQGVDVSGESWEDAERRARAVALVRSRERLNGRTTDDLSG